MMDGSIDGLIMFVVLLLFLPFFIALFPFPVGGFRRGFFLS